MKKFKVPFGTIEVCQNDNYAIVEAKTKEEAFDKVLNSIKYSNVYKDYDSSWEGFNSVTNEVLEVSDYLLGENDGYPVQDVIEMESELFCLKSFSIFDLLRYDKDVLYQMAEQELGIYQIDDMELIPVSFSYDEVTVKMVIKEFLNEYEIKAFFFDIEEDPTTPFEERSYTLYAKTKEEALANARERAEESEIGSESGVSVEIEID